MPTKSPPIGAVTEALAAVLRRGLPVHPATVAPALLELRGVTARSVDPADEASRVAALDGVLRGSLARFPDPRYAPALRALFGMAPARPGDTLTSRRAAAAAGAGHEVHHFRKRVEPRLLSELAAALLADADRFTPVGLVAPRLAPAGERERVPADPFAWEVAEQEEVLTRVWSAVYALRAELLTVERLISLGVDDQQIAAHAVTAAWRWALASNAALTHSTAFSTRSGPDDVEWGAADDGAEMVALAGWTPALSAAQQQLLRAAAATDVTRAQFVAAMHDDAEIGTAWVAGFLDHTRPPIRPSDSPLPGSGAGPSSTQEVS